MFRYLHSIILVFTISVSFAQIPVQELQSPTDFLFGADVAVSEDGSLLAVIKAIQGTTATKVLIYNLEDGKYNLDREVLFEEEATDLAFSNDNKTLIVGQALGNIFRSAKVFFLQRQSGIWNVLAEISDPGNPDDATGGGHAISLGGSTVALAITSQQASKIFVYQFNQNGSIEQKGTQIDANANEQFFGYNLGISGDGNRLSISCGIPNYTKIFDFENGDWIEKATLDNYNGYTALSRNGDIAMFTDGKQLAIYEESTNDIWQIQGDPIVANTEVAFGWNVRDAAFFPESKTISVGMLNASNQNSKIATFDYKEDNWIERRNPFYDKVYEDYTGVDVSTSSDASLLVLPRPRNLNNKGSVEIYNDLSFASLGVAAFLDKNANGIKEDDEVFFTDCKFIVDDETTLYAMDGYTYASVHGIEHNAVVVPNQYGMYSTTDSIVSISYASDEDRLVLFGLYYENPTITGTVHIGNDIMLCNTTDQNRIVIRNTGTDAFTASITLEFKLVEFESSSLEPLMTTDSTIEWETGVIVPGEKLVIVNDFIMPNETFTNQTIEMHGAISLFQEGFTDPAIVKEIDSSFPLRCSYDPNDKAVFPEGVGEDNLTLIDQDLVYRIRFQNTGNFPAQHIVVEDEISDELDIRTLELVETSHPLTQMSQNGRKIRFVFENIMLPDSVNNEPESHGHIFYSIRTNNDIAERTEVENTANIFFDLNAPIITNTTLSTMVSSFPTSTKDIVERIEFDLYPNPASDFIVVPENLVGSHMKVFDLQGRIVNEYNDLTSKVNISKLESGSMYYVIIQKNGKLYSSHFVK